MFLDVFHIGDDVFQQLRWGMTPLISPGVRSALSVLRDYYVGDPDAGRALWIFLAHLQTGEGHL